MLFVLGTLLCPTTKPYVKRSLFSILQNTKDIRNLNCVKLVLNFFVQGVHEYKKKNLVVPLVVCC